MDIWAVLAAIVTLASPGTPGQVAREPGWITGVVSSQTDAAALPCPPRQVVGEWGAVGVGVACFPRRSAHWTIDQLGACTVTSVGAGVSRGNCVRSFADGDVVKVWSYPGAVYEPFEIVWS